CHVDGVVKGSVSADLDGNSALSIAEDGSVEGGVTVPYVLLNGLVKGDAIASQHVELGPTARVFGNVYYNLIQMAMGAEINGKLVHRPAGQAMLERVHREENAGQAHPEPARPVPSKHANREVEACRNRRPNSPPSRRRSSSPLPPRARYTSSSRKRTTPISSCASMSRAAVAPDSSTASRSTRRSRRATARSRTRV